jgi:CheY-like chemotaxis protein
MLINNPSVPINSKPQRILCVDDDPLTLILNKKTISKAFVSEEIAIAKNGREALDFFINDKNLLQRIYPQLIFLDLNMPVMNGWEFLDNFTSTNYSDFKNTKIIILSSTIDPEDFKKAKNYPIVIEFLNKPLTLSELEKAKSNCQLVS